jgi:hypothetical protein
MDGWMDGWMDGLAGRMDGWMDGWMGGVDGRTDGWVDWPDGWIKFMVQVLSGQVPSYSAEQETFYFNGTRWFVTVYIKARNVALS